MRRAILFGVAAVLAACSGPNGTLEADARQPNAFEQFVGEWKLKHDEFQQVWDGETHETILIPGHRTVCAPVNTSKSILCEVDAVDFEGHILWATESNSAEFSHLSHFDPSRLGTGRGSFNMGGDLTIKISFSDEPEGTFRVYNYTWKNDDEYEMISTQFDADGTPTGNWYGGTFVRIESAVE